MNKQLEQDLIKLGATNPELRPHIRPLLATPKQAALNVTTSTWGEVIAAYLQEVVGLVAKELGKAGKPETDIALARAMCSFDIGDGNLWGVDCMLLASGHLRVTLSTGIATDMDTFDIRNDIARGLKPAALAKRITTRLKPAFAHAVSED